MKNELGIEVCCENCENAFDSCYGDKEDVCQSQDYCFFIATTEALEKRIKELQEQLERESKLSQKEIKLLNKKIEKLWNRENEYVSCPSQQFKRCEQGKEVKKMNNIIINGNALDCLAKIEDESIDCILTSPPYDSIRNYDGYCDFDFEKFKLIANESFRILKQGGVIIWIVADQTINGSETGSSFKQALYFNEIGMNIHDTMIWAKNGFSDVASLKYRYAQTFEYMFIFSKGKPKTFNPLKDRKNKHFGTFVHGTIRNSNGTLKPKSNHKKINEFGQRWNVWTCNTCSSQKERSGHPAQMPLQLALDHIQSWTNERDVVLDMFMGSGTTCVACSKLNRNFIGIEINPDYFEIAKKRIENN